MSIRSGLSRLLSPGQTAAIRPEEASREEADRAAALLAEVAAEEGQNAADDDDASEAQDPEDDEGEVEAEGDDAQGEDDEDAEASGDSAQAARLAERTRIAGILRSDAAKGREAQALVLALDSDLSVEQAEQLLKKSPKASARGRLAAQMEAEASPRLGPGGGGGEADGVDEVASALLAHVQPSKG